MNPYRSPNPMAHIDNSPYRKYSILPNYELPLPKRHLNNNSNNKEDRFEWTPGFARKSVDLVRSKIVRAYNIRFFNQNFDFLPKFGFFAKITIFRQNFDCSPKFRFFAKISIFHKKIRFFAKISILSQNFNFSRKFFYEIIFFRSNLLYDKIAHLRETSWLFYKILSVR